MKNRQVKMLIAVLAATTMLAGQAVPVMAEREAEGTETTVDRPDVGSGLSDGDSITVDGYTKGVQGKDPVKGKITVTDAQGTETSRLKAGDVSISSDIEDGVYVYYDGWHLQEDPYESGGLVISEGITSLNGTTFQDGDFFVVSGHKDGDVITEAVAGHVELIDNFSTDTGSYTIGDSLENGTYRYVTKDNGSTGYFYNESDKSRKPIDSAIFGYKGSGSDNASITVEDHKVTDINGKPVNVYQDGMVNGFYVGNDVEDYDYIYLSDDKWHKYNNTGEDPATDPVADIVCHSDGEPADGTIIKTTGHKDAVLGNPTTGTVSFTRQVTALRAQDIDYSEDLENGTYTFNGTSWVDDKGQTLHEGMIVVWEGKATAGDKVTVTGQEPRVTEIAANPGYISVVDCRHGYDDTHFTIGDDLGNGKYTYHADSKTWTAEDGADVTAKIQFSETARQSQTSGDSGSSGSSGSTSSSSGSSSSSSSSSSSTQPTSPSQTADTGSTDDPQKTPDQTDTDGRNTKAGKTSDEVDVPVTDDAKTGLDVAAGTEQDGKYVTDDGVILVDMAVSTDKGVVITDSTGAAVPANSTAKLDGKTFLINDDGVVASSEKVKVGKKTYVAAVDGTIAKKAIVTLPTGNRVYANASGQVVKNKVIRIGKTSYLARKSGALVKNGKVTLRGKTYTVKNYKIVKTVKAKKKKH